ncbi:MAG: phospholipase D-like domain-containing protein [Chitinophagales bacterium]
MKKILLTSIVSLCFLQVKSQISISSARAMATGTTVTVRGIITNGPELGTIRYFQDGTAGIAAYSATMDNVLRGDSVEVTGVISPYNNLIELNPVNSYSVISSNNPMPAPFEVDMASGYNEIYESRLVRFNNSTFISTGTFATSDANYDITDGSLVSAETRVNHLSNIAGTPIPAGPLDIQGIMSQYLSTYQLLVRDLSDLILPGNPPVFTTSLFQSGITTTSFDISFSTQSPGSTIIYYGITETLGSVISDGVMVTDHLISLSGLTAATLYYIKAASVSSSGDTSFSAITPMLSRSLSTQSIKCYFTRPVDNSVAQGINAISLAQIMDDTLIAYMNRAKYTMDVAIYNMDNSNGIIDAINAAYNRGVLVRIIGDGENMGSSAWNELQLPAANKKLSPVSVDYGIMHNKFMVIDAESADPNDAILWTGSLNFTNEQINNDANNVIIFQDQSLAKAYEIEFGEMFAGDFGSFKTNNTPKEFNIDGSRVELYFSPTDDTEGEIKRVAESADHDLEFSVFSFTRITITYSIDDRTGAGVWGGGIIDDTANLDYGYSVLQQHMPNSLFVANNSYIVHHKYLIVDANAPGLDPAVLTGSHNWTNSAQTKNDENTVVVHNASVANQYYQEWVARYHDEGGVDLPSYLVGIYEQAKALPGFNFYPNPATEEITVSLPVRDDATIRITDISGKILEEIGVVHSENIQISTSQFTPGLYLLNIRQGNDFHSFKLIVQK